MEGYKRRRGGWVGCKSAGITCIEVGGGRCGGRQGKNGPHVGRRERALRVCSFAEATPAGWTRERERKCWRGGWSGVCIYGYSAVVSDVGTKLGRIHGVFAVARCRANEKEEERVR
jgi:hypothetical protein